MIDLAHLQLLRKLKADEQRLRDDVRNMDRLFFWMLLAALGVSGAVIVNYLYF